MSRPANEPGSRRMRRYLGRAVAAVGIALAAWSGWLKAEDDSRTVFGIMFVGGLVWIAGRVIADVPSSDETAARAPPEAQATRGWRSFPLTLVLLVLAACWTGITIVAAIVRGDGHGPVFVAALCVMTLVLGGLLVSLWRMARTARRDGDLGRPRLLDGLLVFSTVLLAVGAFTDDWLFRVGFFLFLLAVAVFMTLQRRAEQP